VASLRRAAILIPVLLLLAALLSTAEATPLTISPGPYYAGTPFAIGLHTDPSGATPTTIRISGPMATYRINGAQESQEVTIPTPGPYNVQAFDDKDNLLYETAIIVLPSPAATATTAPSEEASAIIVGNETAQNITTTAPSGAVPDDAAWQRLSVRFQRVTFDRVAYDNTRGHYEIDAHGRGSNTIRLHGVMNASNISALEFAQHPAALATDAIVVEGAAVDNATVRLAKYGPVAYIARCDEYNTTTGSCVAWLPTDIPFQDYGDSIEFTVPHFTGYGGIPQVDFYYVTSASNTSLPNLGASRNASRHNVTRNLAATGLYNFINASVVGVTGRVIRTTDVVNFSGNWTRAGTVTANVTYKLMYGVGSPQTLVCQRGDDSTGGPGITGNVTLIGNCSPSSDIIIPNGTTLWYVVNVYRSGATTRVVTLWWDASSPTWINISSAQRTDINVTTNSTVYRINNTDISVGISGYYYWLNASGINNSNVTVAVYNSTGGLKQIRNVTTNASGYFNDTYSLTTSAELGQWYVNVTGWNSTGYTADDREYFNVTQYGVLNVSLNFPAAAYNDSQNDTFYINATITCTGKIGVECGNISATARYNSTTNSPDTNISTSPFTTPFGLSNPTTNPQTNVSSLVQGQSWNVSWIVNATGGGCYKLDVQFNSTCGPGNVSTNDTTDSVFCIQRPPSISNAKLNITSPVTGPTTVKVNASVTDGDGDVRTVLLEVDPPFSAAYNTSVAQNGNEFYNNTIVLNEGGNWTFKFYANDSQWNNATPTNATDQASANIISVIVYGVLNVSLNAPPDPTNRTQNTTFILNATITCRGVQGAICGNITASARYNASSATANTNISNVSGVNPLWTPKNPQANTSSLTQGQSWSVNFTVNLTGSACYEVDTLFNSSYASITGNDTDDAMVCAIFPPAISSARINASSPVIINTTVKVNASVNGTGLDMVLLQVTPPTGNPFNTTPLHNSDSGPWYNTSWLYRKNITFNASEINGTNSNFSVLVSIASDSNLAAAAQSSGNDILFTSSDGQTKLPHEIELYNGTTGRLVAWVRMPVLSNISNASNTIYLYYGNSSVGDQSNKTGVWDSSYLAVYHMNQVPPSTIADSTNLRNLTPTSCNTSAGQIGSAIAFNGTASRLVTASYTVNLSSFTIEAWVSNNNTGAWGTGRGNGWEAIVNIDNNGTNLDFTAYPGTENGALSVDDGSPTQISVGQNGTAWRHVVARYNGGTNGNLRGFINGTMTSYTPTKTWTKTNSRIVVGAWPSSGTAYTDYWYGSIDEVRVSATNRTNEWIQTEYKNQRNGTTFTSVGAQEGQGGGGSSNEYYNDSITLNISGRWTFTFYTNDTQGQNATPTLAQDGYSNFYIDVAGPPVITNVTSITPVTPLAGQNKSILLNFTATSDGGVALLNDSTARTAFTNGTTTRSGSCTPNDQNTTSTVYNCSVMLTHYDPAGVWRVNVSVSDTSWQNTSNSTTTFTYNPLIDIQLNTSSYNFGTFNPNSGWQASTGGPILIDNRGNTNLTLNITASALTNGTNTINASNVTINITNALGKALINNTEITIPNATVPADTATTEQNRSLYFYINTPMTAPGTYTAQSNWVITAYG